MGYLGLDETPVKDDNLFQRLFWPSDHANRAAYLGSWVSVLVAAYLGSRLLYQRQWLVGLFTAAFYLIGGCGIRTGSIIAGVMLAMWCLLGQVGNLLMRLSPSGVEGIASVAFVCCVVSMWNGTRAHKRSHLSGAPVSKEHHVGSFDHIVRRVWRIGRIPFMALGGTMVAVSLYGTALAMRHGQAAPLEHDGPSLSAPSR